MLKMYTYPNNQTLADSLQKILYDTKDVTYLEMERCVIDMTPRNWSLSLRMPKEHHLLYAFSGKGQYLIGEKSQFDNWKQGETEVPVKARDLVWIPPGLSFRVINDPKNPLTVMGFRFNIKKLIDDSYCSGLNNPTYAVVEMPELEPLERLMHKLNSSFKLLQRGKADIDRCTPILKFILNELYDVLREATKTEKQNHLSSPGLRRAIEFIDANPTNRPSIKELADIAQLSPRYFSKVFAKEVGISPMHYIIERRMNYAYYLTEESGMNMAEISRHLGFTDQFAFSKQFKATYGMNPSQLRRT